MGKDNDLHYYYQNHPSKLQEDDEFENSYVLQQKLDLSAAWLRFSKTFAFVDLSILLDNLKTAAYQVMVTSEEEERKKLPGYHSDAWFKGRLSVLADLKHHINEQLNSHELLAEMLKEAKETEELNESLS